jgi:hypothetical protein
MAELAMIDARSIGRGTELLVARMQHGVSATPSGSEREPIVSRRARKSSVGKALAEELGVPARPAKQE